LLIAALALPARGQRAPDPSDDVQAPPRLLAPEPPPAPAPVVPTPPPAAPVLSAPTPPPPSAPAPPEAPKHQAGLSTTAMVVGGSGVLAAVAVGGMAFLSPCCALGCGCPTAAAALGGGAVIAAALAPDEAGDQTWLPPLVGGAVGGTAGLLAGVLALSGAALVSGVLPEPGFDFGGAQGNTLASSSVAAGAALTMTLIGTVAGVRAVEWAQESSRDNQRKRAQLRAAETTASEQEVARGSGANVRY
jgi:hypothetical protein